MRGGLRVGGVMGIIGNFLLIGSATAMMAAARTSAGPDLVVVDLAATPTEAAAGAEIEIFSAVKNLGKRTRAAIDVDIGVFARATDASPLAPLTAWSKSSGLKRNQKVDDAARVFLPGGLAAGDYYLCADIDPDGAIAESDESNNRRCASFKVNAAPGGETGKADLVIDKVTAIERSLASLKVRIKLRNVGAETINQSFKVKAFRRNPRLPLYLATCALTDGQLAAGSPAGCPDLTFEGTLAPGATTEIDGYFNYYVAGASLVTQPLNPGATPAVESAMVDFMVDGCFPPIDGEAVWCAINEIDEINNFRSVRLPAR